MLSVSLQNLSSSDWLITLVAAPCILFITGMVYNLTLHPLAHVPGPFWARASGIPSWYYAIRGDRHLWLLQYFRNPDVKRMRVAPNEVVFRDPEAYKAIYGAKANVRRSQFYTALERKHDEPTTLTTVDVAEHHRRRKMLSMAFTEKTVRAASGFVVQHVDRWNQIMMDENPSPINWSEVCNMSEKIDQLIFDIMGDLSFGRSFDIKEPGENPLKVIPHTISEYMKFYYPMCRAPFIDLLAWMKPHGLDAFFELITPPAVREYNEFVYHSVTKGMALYKEQLKQPEEQRRKDILYFLCDAKDPETGLPVYNESDLRGESNLLVIAGSDTTAISLSSLFFYLTGDPTRCDKLVNEVLTTFPNVDDIVYGPKLLGCIYVKACIDEAMRLTPSGPSEMPREILPGGQKILDEHYPAGVIVGSAPWLDCRNHAVYGDECVFRPERWIAGSSPDVTKETVAAMRNNFHPFTTGLGACLGKNVAYAEMMITVARTLHRLEVRRAPGSTLGGGRAELGWGASNEKEMHVRDAYVTLRQGPEVQFRRRAPKMGSES